MTTSYETGAERERLERVRREQLEKALALWETEEAGPSDDDRRASARDEQRARFRAESGTRWGGDL